MSDVTKASGSDESGCLACVTCGQPVGSREESASRATSAAVRERFEAWAKSQHYSLNTVGDPDYDADDTYCAWQAWRAALTTPSAVDRPAEPIAFVPVHPRNGPLWAMTTNEPNPERLPSYPLMPLYEGAMDRPKVSPGPDAVRSRDRLAAKLGMDIHMARTDDERMNAALRFIMAYQDLQGAERTKPASGA